MGETTGRNGWGAKLIGLLLGLIGLYMTGGGAWLLSFFWHFRSLLYSWVVALCVGVAKPVLRPGS